MLKELLSMTWDEMMESDYIFKSNTEKHVIDINGVELEDGNESVTVIFYHMWKGTPMVILQRYPYAGATIDVDDYPDFNITIAGGEDESGPYTEISFVLKAIVKALTE